MLSPLAKLILTKTGLTVAQFCEQHLGSKYKTWQMRQRKKQYYPAEVIYICWFLNVTCEEAFGYPFSKLVMSQGKYGVPEKVLGQWQGADFREKNRLLGLLGLAEVPRNVVPKVTVTPREKPPEHTVEFFIDTNEPEVPPNEDRAPEGKETHGNDPLKDLFIETY